MRIGSRFADSQNQYPAFMLAIVDRVDAMEETEYCFVYFNNRPPDFGLVGKIGEGVFELVYVAFGLAT